MSKKRTAITIAIGFVIFIFGYSIGSSNTGSSTASKTTTASTPTISTQTKPAVKDSYKLGEVATSANGATLVISNLKKSNGGEYDSVKPGNELVMVTVSIKNTGTDTISYNEFDYKIKNSKGQITNGTSSSISNSNQLNYGELAVGGTVSGTLVYEQPKNDPALTLIYTGSMFSSEGINFKLN